MVYNNAALLVLTSPYSFCIYASGVGKFSDLGGLLILWQLRLSFSLGVSAVVLSQLVDFVAAMGCTD